MITGKQVDRMSRQLHDYDVRDGGWEQESKGFEANAKHVLTHLAKDLIIKDFRDKAAVTTPDFLSIFHFSPYNR